MTERNPTPAPATLVAIDIAKHRHEVLIEAPGQSRRRRLTILNTKADHDRLVETLTAYGRPVIIGFEATGNYHRGAGLPPALSRLRAAAGLVRGARPDPRGAAQRLGQERSQGCAGHPAHAQDRCDAALLSIRWRAGINDLQELSKTHEAISKAKTETWHRILTHYLPLYFPEIDRFAGNSRSRLVPGVARALPDAG